MNRRRFVGVAASASLTGCTGLSGSDERSRLELGVRNDRADPVTVRVVVVDEKRTTYEERVVQIDSGVARAFEVAVGTAGRHELTVSGDDFQGQLAWNADTCARFEGTVGVTDESVEVAGECLDQR